MRAAEDEFGREHVMLCVTNDANSDSLIQRVDEALSAPINITPTIAARCRASIADTRTVGRDSSTLLAAADDAMYNVKRTPHAVRGA